MVEIGKHLARRGSRAARPWSLGILAFCGLVLGAAAPAAAGDVQIKVKADGSKVIFNESRTHRARRLSTRLETPRAEISYLIDYYARRQNLNPRLVQAVIQVESGFNHRARSSKGAMGLMQLMPATADLLGVIDPYDPGQNIRGGTRYLRQQLDSFSNLSLALAAYNAGPSAVSQYGGIPPYRETRDYVRKVLALLGLAAPAERPSQGDAAALSAAAPPRGKKVYLHRGEDNRIFFTTVPPKKSR